MASQGPWGGGSGGGDDEDRDKRPVNRPWGQQQPPKGPQRPGGPQQMPEIEELMKKGQERLRVLMGGRGSGNGNGPNGGGPRRPQSPGFQLNRTTLTIGGLVLLALWAFASFYRVQTNERSVEFLFGRAVAVGTEGLNFAPWPFVTAPSAPSSSASPRSRRSRVAE